MDKPLVYLNANQVPKDAKHIEAYDNSIEELFYIRNPKYKKQMPESASHLADFKKANTIPAIFVYYPWAHTAVRTVPEEIYYELRTARNRNVITLEEQIKYRGTTVGIAGLSIGSAVLHSLVITGGPKTIKVADFDVVEISNLNRMRAGLLDVGSPKLETAARQVWEVDPFTELELWDQGITAETLEKFVAGSPKLDIFIDEFDSLDLKVLARIICKQHKIPVVMATNNGDSFMIDVERFDLEPQRPMFHGYIPELQQSDLQNLSYPDWIRMALQIVRPEDSPERMLDTLKEIGQTVSGVPQLGSTGSASSGAITFVVRRIANGDPMPSGRYLINFEETFVPGYNTPENREILKQKRAAIKQAFGKK